MLVKTVWFQQLNYKTQKQDYFFLFCFSFHFLWVFKRCCCLKTEAQSELHKQKGKRRLMCKPRKCWWEIFLWSKRLKHLWSSSEIAFLQLWGIFAHFGVTALQPSCVLQQMAFSAFLASPQLISGTTNTNSLQAADKPASKAAQTIDNQLGKQIIPIII